MDLTYVPSWLTIGDRDAEGWPKFVTAEQRVWLVNAVKNVLAEGRAQYLNTIVYCVFRLDGAPKWALIDSQMAATHRALLAAGCEQVWKARTST